MKKYTFLVLAATIAGFTSCKDKVESPDSADFSWYFKADYDANMQDLSKAPANPDTVELSDQLVFVANSTDADTYVVWPGEPSTDYTLRELPDSLVDSASNNVSMRASGIALSTVDAMKRYTKTYNYTAISPVGEPFQMYGTSRNYDYELGDYAETKAGPYSIVVVDTQTDLWDPDDPYNANGALKYDLTFKVGGKRINKTTTGAKGSYTLVYEGESKGGIDGPGVLITYPVGADASNVELKMKINNCIPVQVSNGTVSEKNSFGIYTWTFDLSGGQTATLTLASQSASPDAKSGDPLTKDYVFVAQEYSE